MRVLRKSETDARLAAVRTDLVAAKARLAEIDTRRAAALEDSRAFATWSGERQSAATEIDRLEQLIASVIADDEASRKDEAEAAVRKRIVAARKNNAAVAERMRTEYPKLAAQLKALARDVALSQLETNAINRALPEGTPHLQDANNLARGRAAIPRENVSEKTVSLWVRATDGSLMGDQDAIVDVGGIGHLFVNNTRVDCVRREFRSIQYHPEIWCEIPEHFHKHLSLPNCDRQGADFQGHFLIEEHVAALDLDPAKQDKEQRRPVQTELIPTSDWVVPETKPIGEAAAANE
ncbi:hypothetical protein GPL21_33410 [Bradyrhizobium pachyrhizi]|uniref:Uncharacterized protein n=1 Tax=Bradyrhizobium pachyrhizi TaxID=280333 RepID=A0A844T1L9_9BRAD|nr:hypothetical protein [Bradyrhizobium pachyrhizi]MVT69984.1 hypothetical protein [Bradyrhizobium pachyrhizi]